MSWRKKNINKAPTFERHFRRFHIHFVEYDTELPLHCVEGGVVDHFFKAGIFLE